MRIHSTIVLSIFLLLISGVITVGQEQAPDTAYDITIQLDPDQDTISGTQRVTYTNRTEDPVVLLRFALIANWGAEQNPYLHPAVQDAQYIHGFDPTYTLIHSVTNAVGEALTYTLNPLPPLLQIYSLENGILSVELPTPLPVGSSIDLEIEFETKFAAAITGDQSVLGDTYVWRFGWNPVLVGASAEEGRFELPAANYTVEVVIPANFDLLAGADHQELISTTDELVTLRLTNDRPVRSVPLVLGKSFDVVRSEWQGTEIVSATLEGGESFARIALTHIEELLAYYAATYGPLPNRRLVIMENPAPGFFGMAADGMILVGSSAVRLRDMPALDAYARVNEYLLAHELAHLYWGIGIGADFNAENWISEGFSEYLSITYFEEKHGGFDPNLLSHLGEGLIEDVLLESFGYLNLRQHISESQYLALLLLGFDEPIIQPMIDSQYINGLVARTYNKGYLVLRALEAVIGKDQLNEVLSQAHAQWQTALVSVEDLRALAEDVSGEDLASFFDAWLYGSTQYDASILGFDSVRAADGYETTLELAGANETFPLEIAAMLEDGTIQEAVFAADCCSAVPAPLMTDSPVVSIHLDPGERLPDANRFNNHWPRRILLDHPLRDKEKGEIGKPLDAYVIELTPAGIAGQFRNEQAWSLMVLPHVDPDVAVDSLDDLSETLDVVGSFASFVSRDLRLYATLLVTALDPATGSGELDAFAYAQISTYTNPLVGAAGTYWDPTLNTTLGFGVKGTTLQPIPYLGLTFNYAPILTSFFATQVDLVLGVPGVGIEPFGSLELSVAKRLRLWPLCYLDVGLAISETLFVDLPNEFLFSLDRLHAFEYLPMGHHQQYASMELTLPPIVRNAGYAIFNLTRLDSITPSVYLRGGRTQANCVDVCEPGIRVEAGAALSLRFPLFLGTSVEFKVGLAQPLIGMDGELSPFVEFGSTWGASF